MLSQKVGVNHLLTYKSNTGQYYIWFANLRSINEPRTVAGFSSSVDLYSAQQALSLLQRTAEVNTRISCS
jgi:hypothetical protein